MYRVLKPNGRLLIADFHKGPQRGHLAPRWFHRSLGEGMLDKALRLVSAAGFADVTSGATNLGWLGRITARKPAPSGPGRGRSAQMYSGRSGLYDEWHR
jgi:hypothetical protein